MVVSRRVYDQNVFINCPFDRDSEPIFHALVFAVFDCGFRKRNLPAVAAVARLNPARLTYVDYCYTISEWLKANAR